ncbi:ArnT family glycosyltransferase [Runella sp.]|uniref:ArnT family glycosyltransferase n=1 Tax=Runella sp. TaxID=1960881 RepID=UPI003D0BACB4
MNSATKSTKSFWWLFGLYAVICVGFAIFRQYPLRSDSLVYFTWASRAAQMRTWFPYPETIYDPWLASLFHVNLGALFLRIYNATVTVHLLNAGINLLQLYLVYRLTLKFFGEQSALTAAWMYVLYLNSLGLVVLNLSELTFTTCTLLSSWFYFQKPNFKWGFLSGLMAGFALGCRPLIVALLLIYGLVWLWNWKFNQRNDYKQLIGIGLGVLLFVLPMGMYSKSQTGQFVYSTTTGPINLLMSGFDGATGIYNDSILKNDSVYLSKKTFYEKGDYIQNRAVKWIVGHPAKWLSFWPLKIKTTFVNDDIAISPLLGNPNWNFERFIKDARQPRAKRQFWQQPLAYCIAFLTIHTLQFGYYLLLLGVWGYQLVFYWRQRPTAPLIVWVVNGFTFLGFMMTYVGSQGNLRYKYPYLVISFIIIAPVITFLKNVIAQRKTLSP